MVSGVTVLIFVLLVAIFGKGPSLPELVGRAAGWWKSRRKSVP